jgi:hypothetical protein
VTGTADPAGAGGPRGARERFGFAPDRDLRARVRRLARRALDQPGGGRGVRGRDRSVRVLHVSGRRDYAELAGRATIPSWPPAAGYDLREYLDLAEFADALAAADLVVARAGGSVFEIAAHGRRRSSCPTRTPPATTRARTRAGWRGGRRGGDRRRRAERCAPGGEVAALLGGPRAPGGDGAGREAGWPARTPPEVAESLPHGRAASWPLDDNGARAS